MHLRAPLALLAVAALGALGSCATPTLPLPPPTAISTAPDAMGIVTITGEALDGAFVSVLNERTERGAITRADDGGAFEVQLAADAGDDVTVWQHQGTARGPSTHIVVPAPRE